MQRIFTNFKFNYRTVISIVVIICLFALGFALSATLPQITNEETIVAKADTTINAGNYRQVMQNNGGTGTISGTFVLSSDISISPSIGYNVSTFNGTFDGQGHTIYVTGSANHDAPNNQDNYIGFLFGTLGSSAVVKNVNISWSAYWNVRESNNVTSGSYTGNGSTTLYLGGLCALAKSGARIENVTFTLTSTIAGIGKDTGTNHETQTSGQGAVVGAMVGRSQGARLTNIRFNNNGSVYARGHNVSAGSYRKGGGVILSSDNRPDRAVAGGIIGELQSGSTVINNLYYGGSGFVGAATTGYTTYVNVLSGENQVFALHVINFAGGILGFNYGSNSTLTINGMIYNYSGRCYVKESTQNSGKTVGTILGKGGGLTINGLWRRTDDSSSSSGVGTLSYFSETSGPSYTGAGALSVEKTVASSSFTNVAQGPTSAQSNTYNLKEYKPTAYYLGESVSFATGIISGIENGYLTIDAVSNDPKYYISALTYNTVYNGTYTSHNYYEHLVNSVTFEANEYKIPYTCYEFKVVLATTSATLEFKQSTGNKSYDTLGITFEGAANKDNKKLLSDLYWASEHDTNPQNNTRGLLGSYQVTTSPNVGTYSMALYRYDAKTGTSTKLKNGDGLGSNLEDAPSTIYIYNDDLIADCKYTISRAEVDLVPLSNPYTRQYDATSKVDGNSLIYKSHYGFYLAGTTNEPKDTPQFTIGSGDFYDSTGTTLDGSVGANKIVKISGIEVTGNYILSENSGTTLTLYNCIITERVLDCQWQEYTLSQTYNGSLLTPSIEATNLITGDIVFFTVTVYDTIQDAISKNPVTGVTNVKDGSKGDTDYYVVRATIASNPNYIIQGGYAQAYMYVTKKEIGLTWTSFEKTFEYADQQVTCVVTNANTVIPSGEDVGLQISYYHNETAQTTALRNAGTYVATASITNENFVLSEATRTFSNIKINPIALDVVFYTGKDYSSNVVQSLVYKGASYVGDEEGLHAKIAPNSTGKGLIDANISISYSGDVKNVATYTATASFVDSDENLNEDIIITNYSVKNSQQALQVVQRDITLTYGQDSFEYDGDINGKTITASIDEGRCDGDIITVRGDVYILSGAEYVKTTAINAGSYIVQYTLNNSNYKIKSGYASRNLTITQYDISQANTKAQIEDIADVEYTGYEITPNVIVKFNGNQMQSENFVVSVTNNKVVGTANVTVTGKNNFKGNLYSTFTITKALLTVKFTSPTSLQYNGNVQNVTAIFEGYKANDTEIAMLISYEGSKIPKDKGTYTATVSFDGNPQNYTLSEYEKDRQHTFEITEKPIEITFSGYNGLIYNGTNRKYNATTNPDGIKVAFKDDSSIYPNDKLSLSLEFRNVSTNQIEDPTNAGTYTATAELTGDSKANYTLSKDNPTSIRFTIDKYLIDIIYNLATVSHVYSASEKKATYTISEETPLIINPTTGLEEGANIVLRYKNLDSEQTINGNPVNAGSYQIVASIGNSNYTTDTTKVQNFVIRKAPLEVSHNLVNGGVYYYEAKEINISYSYTNSTGTFGGDTFSLISTYYDATNTITDACINAGSYKVTSQLPANNVMANNYYISNPDEEGGLTHSSTFVIKPRYISVKFDMNSNNNTYYYNGLERVVTADIGENNGFIDDSEYTNNSGVMNDENEKVEAVTFLVKTYLGTVISDEYLVPYIKDKGTYTATAVLDPNNPVNVNYTIYEGDQRVYPTTSTIIINPKEIVFKSNTVNFSKTYGDNDPRFILQLTSENTNGGLYDTDEIYVQMIRIPGETVGSYNYSGFNFVKKIVGENNNVSYETINPEDVDSNYDIQYYGNSGETDRFVINVKRISFDAQKFEFDYKTDIVNLIQEIQLNLPAIGDVVVRIKLQPINELIKNGIDAGTYDLASSFKEVNALGDEEDNPNIECEMNEGSNKGKLIVIGRSVKVLLYNVPNDSEKDIYTFTNNTYYITYGDTFEHEDGTTSYDPDYYYGISIDYANCDPSITETTYKSYVRITREAITNSYIQGIPYKETGYTLTIDFLKFENGVYVVDKNYRAVDENGRNVNYKLFVNKFNLNNVFSNSTENKENWPVVNLEKSYDGNKSAKIDPAFTNIPEIFESHHLSVYAEYDNANAGVNKIVNVIYKFKVNDYANNYILPGDDGKLVYSEEGIINKVKLTLTFNQADYALTYGEYYSSNPNGEYEVAYPTLLYKGFVNNETPEHLNLADNIVLTYQNSQSLASIQTAGSHTIIIYDKKGVYDNYYLDCSATQSVIVSERMVTITAGATFVKTVDGTTSAEISSENYVINGIIPSDENTTNALNVVYDAYLNSSNPGKATVIMRVKGLTGTKNENYKLPDDEDSKTILIPAIINELAVVKFDSESYSFDFDNTPKSVAPTIDESTVQENVEYILKYVGKRYDGKDYLLQTSAPKSAGVYTINCYFYHIADKNDTTKYRLLASTEMIINKITPTLYFTGNYSQTYGSFTPINATVMAPGLNQSVEVRYSFENEDGSLPAFPPAGRHTVYASYDETNDYLDVEGEQIVQIKTKTISVSFDGYKGLIYNGYTRNDDIKVTFNGIVEGDTCTPVKIYNVDEVRNAGTYRLIVTPSNSSYTISGSNSIEFTIAKKVLQVSAPSEITTTAGNTPKIELIYTGFVENEGVEDISVLPTPKISSGKVGINVIEFNDGFDENYSFNYINGVYTIVYESANEDKPNVTPYVVTGCAVGGVAIVFVLGYLVKIGNYKAITSGVAKRKIRKEMMGKKK